MAYMCTENKIPEKPFDFFSFSFLQVALSLEDHSSEVQVVKHLLHILSHPPRTLPTSSAGRRSTEKHPKHLCTQVHGLHLGEWRVYQVQKMIQVSSDALFSPRKFHSRKSHWFLCFSPTFFLHGQMRRKHRMTRGSDTLNYKNRKRYYKSIFCTDFHFYF